MIKVLDKFDQQIYVDSLVAVATNSGIFIGRVTKFNTYEHSDGTPRLSTVQVKKTDGRKFSYDVPHARMVNLDAIHNVVERLGI